MTEIIFRVIELFVMLAVLGYVAWMKKIREGERAAEIFDNIQMWADIVVRWAADRLDGEPGESRRNAAINALKDIRDRLGIELTDDQIAMLISSAYRVMMEDAIEVDGTELIGNIGFET